MISSIAKFWAKRVFGPPEWQRVDGETCCTGHPLFTIFSGYDMANEAVSIRAAGYRTVEWLAEVDACRVAVRWAAPFARAWVALRFWRPK